MEMCEIGRSLNEGASCWLIEAVNDWIALIKAVTGMNFHRSSDRNLEVVLVNACLTL